MAWSGEGFAATERGERIYAVGDVHGRFDLLNDLLERIKEHHAMLPRPSSMHIVLLGDLIDRGPDSAQVIRFVHGIQQRTNRLIVLHGNHEELMLKALAGDERVFEGWMRVGGDATLRSFGIDVEGQGLTPREAVALARDAIPPEWLDWLKGLPLTARSGDYLFCHAGIRPGVSFKRQVRRDLLWIRDQFLEDDGDHGAVIVHGHSIASDVEVRHNRIGIDTGAYRTGVLTALYLEGIEREIIATPAPAPAPIAETVTARR